MSLPAMDSQPTLFGSVPSVAGALFSEDDRYRLFARKVWPVLAGTRAALEKCYCPDNGRPGVEPVLLMGNGTSPTQHAARDRKRPRLNSSHTVIWDDAPCVYQKE